MQTTQRPLGQRVFSGFLRLLITLFVIGLIGLVGYLVSERNARTYSFSLEGGNLVVMKGKMFPTGSAAWSPSDPALADAYAPVPLEGVSLEGSFLIQTFGDRDELDRALFTVFERQARPRIASEDPKEIDRGAYFVRRMQRLSGLTAEQRATMEQLESELAWYLARLKLDQARQMLSDALHQLDVAATGQSKNAQRANNLAAQIAQPARHFEETLRRALGGLPAPAPAAPTAGPDAAPPPTTPTGSGSPSGSGSPTGPGSPSGSAAPSDSQQKPAQPTPTTPEPTAPTAE